jgi:hypothetical protein
VPRSRRALRERHGGYVPDFDSKGVSAPDSGWKGAWRKLMMDELAVKWDAVLPPLSDYDAIGVSWREMGSISHFCGNFWHASIAYVRKLAPFRDCYEHPPHAIYDAVSDKRLGCEFWIGSTAGVAARAVARVPQRGLLQPGILGHAVCRRPRMISRRGERL